LLKKRKKYTSEEKVQLFTQYRDGDSSCYTELLEAYVPLVEIIATKIKSKVGPSVELGDLISDGFFGLADAIEKFDESKGYKFETYASTRVRGAIFDSLRDYDWVSRYSRIKFKTLDAAKLALSEKLQREPTADDIAIFLDWSINEVSKTEAAWVQSFPLDIDGSKSVYGDESFDLKEIIPDTTLGEPDFDFISETISAEFEVALSSLSEQESVVVYLHHYESLPFVRIAEELNIGAARVSRIYSGALETLKSKLLES